MFDILNDKKKLVTFLAITLLFSMLSINQSVAPLTFPVMAGDFNLDYGWAFNAFLLPFAIMAVIGGKLGDVYGKRKVITAGVVIFTIGTIGNNFFVDDNTSMIVMRALQGLGAAIFIPSTAPLLMDNFEGPQQGRAMGLYNSGSMLLMILCTFLAGWLLEDVSWQSVYLLTVPLSVIGLALLFWVTPKDSSAKVKVNFLPVVLFIPAFVLITMGFQNIAYASASESLTYIGGGAVLLLAFIQTQRKFANPLIELSLFKNKVLMINAAILMMVFVAMFAQGMYGALYLQSLLGLGPKEAAIWSTVTLISMMIFSAVSGSLFDKIGAKKPLVIGTLCIASSYFLQALVLDAYNIWLLAPSLVLLGVGFGLIFTPAYTMALGAVEPEEMGQAAGLLENLNQLSGTLAFALTSAFVASMQSEKFAALGTQIKATAEQIASFEWFLTNSPEAQSDLASKIGVDLDTLVMGIKVALTESYSYSFYIAGIAVSIAVVIAAVMIKEEMMKVWDDEDWSE